MIYLIWIGIAFCLSQSALFSGLTIGFFGLSRLRLELQAEGGSKPAQKVLALRKDANFLLATLLWGNVCVNVLLTLLTESILAGTGAFLFSTIGITLFGEVGPQAYFTRHALRTGSLLIPIVRFYQVLLYPVSKPTAMILDWWLGKEGISYFQEEELKIMLNKHINQNVSDIGRVEGIGALNFLSLDDIAVEDEGEVVDPESIISLPDEFGRPDFPKYEVNTEDPFLKRIQKSKKKWVIITDFNHKPCVVLDADQFLRDVFFEKKHLNPFQYCHRPILVLEPGTKLGKVINQLKVHAEHAEDDVIDHDLILFWTGKKKIITGSDVLGRLLRGIVARMTKTD